MIPENIYLKTFGWYYKTHYFCTRFKREAHSVIQLLRRFKILKIMNRV